MHVKRKVNTWVSKLQSSSTDSTVTHGKLQRSVICNRWYSIPCSMKLFDWFRDTKHHQESIRTWDDHLSITNPSVSCYLTIFLVYLKAFYDFARNFICIYIILKQTFWNSLEVPRKSSECVLDFDVVKLNRKSLSSFVSIMNFYFFSSELWNIELWYHLESEKYW